MDTSKMKTVLIVCVLMVLSGCEAIQAVDQAMYTVTDSMTQKDKVTGKRVLSNSRAEQIAKGNKAALGLVAKLDAEGVPYNAQVDEALYSRVVNIFDKVQKVSHLKSEYWNVVLIDDEQFNAFVTGGTYVFVFSGLAKQLDDDELAAVLGHELAHVSANHVGEQSMHMKFSSSFGSSTGRDSFKSAFTHEGEEEADRIGILYSALAGFDPYAAYRVWKKKYDAKGDYATGFVDHPVYSERADQCKAVASKVSQYYQAGVVNTNHARILKDNPLYSYAASGDAVEAGKGGGFLALLSTTLESTQKHNAAKAEERRQKNRIEMLKAVNSLMKVKAVKQLSGNKWQVTVQYIGNKRISGLRLGGAIYNNNSPLAEWSGKPSGYLSPNQTYNFMMEGSKSLPQNTKFDGYVFSVTEAKVI